MLALLHISKVPEIRDQIRNLSFHCDSPPDRLHMDLIGTHRSIAIETEYFVQNEWKCFVDSPEMVHLFIQCFRNLKLAANLEKWSSTAIITTARLS